MNLSEELANIRNRKEIMGARRKKIVIDVSCPSCGEESSNNLGPIPPADFIGGRELERVIPGGDLYQCESCLLSYRFPRLCSQELNDSYTQAEDGRWESLFFERKDWNIGARWIRERGESGRVLDVGCNDGSFLTGLGHCYSCYGIEFNPLAAEKSKRRGVHIIGNNIQKDIRYAKPHFNAITAFDVIEHMENPLFFLQSLFDKVTPGGEVIVSTGNTDSLSWRFMGSRYWYCVYPEHITFINPRWAEKTARLLGVSLVEVVLFSHVDGSFSRKCNEALKNIAYKLFPSFAGWFRVRGFGKANAKKHLELATHPPGWITAKDHVIFRFRK